MDWLDKLEKRLRKSPKSAADAEEISEELDVSFTFYMTVYFAICVVTVTSVPFIHCKMVRSFCCI
jgi:hypothetical protein